MAGGDLLGSGDVTFPNRAGNLYKAVTISSANGTTPVTMVTGSPGYYITDMGCQLDANCTIAVAGMISVFFSDSVSGGIFTLRWFVPANFAPGNAPMNLRQVTGPGQLIWNSKSANSVLTANTDTALTATGGGMIRFFVRYGLTSMLG